MNMSNFISESLSISYQYSFPSPEFSSITEGFNASATQSIVNNLPQWMKARSDTTSTGWKLVNSWGQNLEVVLNSIKEALPDRYLASSNVRHKSQLGFFDIDNEESITDRSKNNLLFNSAFVIKDVARNSMPAGWNNYNSNSDSVYLTNDKTFICPGTIKIDTNGKFGQSLLLDNESVSSITSSIYFLADCFDINIIMLTQIELIDGSSISRQSKVTNRSTEWRRLVTTIPVNAQVYRIRFLVFSDCNEPTYFNAPQIEISAKHSRWSASTRDFLPYYPSSTPFSCVSVIGNSGEFSTKTCLFPINSEEEFLSADIPTEISYVVLGNPGQLAPYTNNIYGRKVSFHNEIFDTQWVVEDNKIKIKSFSPSQFDVFRELEIKDLSFNEEGEYGVFSSSNLSLTPLLCAINGSKLFILCKEVYNNNTKYVIKISNAKEPVDGKDYLESLVDFSIEVPINNNQFFNEVEEKLTVLSFSEIDPSYMCITTNLGRQFYYKLSYDYYYYQDNAKRLYTIESYTNNNKIQTL